MSKRLMRISVIAVMVFAAGLIAYSMDFQVSGLNYNGYMTGTGDTDWLHLQAQEGTHPTICLSHGGGVDFDIAVYNDNYEVCSNIGMENYTCCNNVPTPGSVKVKVWSANGSGNYSVTINP